MHQMRTCTRAAMAASAMVVLLAACGTSEPESDTARAGETTRSTTEAASDSVFRWGAPAGMPLLDPHRIGTPYLNMYLYPMYDALTRQQASGEIVPSVASEWTIIDEPPALELTLRDDAFFHSGAPIDAEAVKANIERAKTLDGSAVAGALEPVVSVDVLGPRTLRLVLEHPFPDLPAALSDRAGMLVDPAVFDGDFPLLGAGSGPYRVTDFDPGQSIRFEAVEGYWDPSRQATSRVEMTTIASPEDRLNALVAGQLDATEIEADQISRAESSDFTVTSGVIGTYYRALINTSSGIMQSNEVRRAINHAIDREGIAAAAFDGGCVPSLQQYPSGHVAYSESLPTPADFFDLDTARSLLADAGVDTPVQVEIITNAGLYEAAVEILQANLADIGIEATITPVPAANIVEVFYVQGEGDLVAALGNPTPAPAVDAQREYLPDSFSNPGKQSTPEIIDLVERALAAKDLESRNDLLRQLQEEALDYSMILPICHFERTLASTPEVDGLEIYSYGNWDFSGVSVG